MEPPSIKPDLQERIRAGTERYRQEPSAGEAGPLPNIRGLKVEIWDDPLPEAWQLAAPWDLSVGQFQCTPLEIALFAGPENIVRGHGAIRVYDAYVPFTARRGVLSPVGHHDGEIPELPTALLGCTPLQRVCVPTTIALDWPDPAIRGRAAKFEFFVEAVLEGPDAHRPPQLEALERFREGWIGARATALKEVQLTHALDLLCERMEIRVTKCTVHHWIWSRWSEGEGAVLSLLDADEDDLSRSWRAWTVDMVSLDQARRACRRATALETHGDALVALAKTLPVEVHR